MSSLVEGLPDEVRSRPRTEREMTNYDGSIDDGLEDDLRAGMVGKHAAWHFNGSHVWYDEPSGLFYEAVFVYHELTAVIGRPGLRELMEAVNDRFGRD